MEKAKKGPQAKQVTAEVESDEETPISASTKASKKKDKKNKKKHVEVDSDDGDDDTNEPVGTGASRFGFLDVEDKSGDEGSDSEPQVVTKSAQQKAKKQSKTEPHADENHHDNVEAKSEKTAKKKKGKDKKMKEDEDIDAILAELSLQNNGVGSEKKDKKKKGAKPAVEEQVADAKMEQQTNASAAESLADGNRLRNLTQDEIAKAMEEMYPSSEDEKKAKKKKNKKKVSEKVGTDDTAEQEKADNTNAGSQKNKKDRRSAVESDVATVVDGSEATEKPSAKTVNQKKKESKNEAKLGDKSAASSQNAALEKTSDVAEKDSASQAEPAVVTEAVSVEGADKEDGDEAGKKSKKDKKKKKGEKDKKEDEKKETKKPPQSKLAQKILEQQRLIREEEERLRREEEEKIRKEEEAERLREEKARLEREKKEREKQKKKERIERQKAEGTYLTAEQREKKRRALAMLEALKQQGAEIPSVSPGGGTSAEGERRKTKVVYDTKKKKKPQQTVDRQESETSKDGAPAVVEEIARQQSEEATVETAEVTTPDTAPEEQPAEEENVKETWDESSAEEEDDGGDDSPQPEGNLAKSESAKLRKKESVEEDDDDDEEEEDDDDDEEDDESSSEEETDSSSEEDDGKSAQERAKEKAAARIKARKEEAEAKRSLDVLRAPVVCVLGHVDTGKTKILDKLRRTNVQDGEAGGITQQIGATNVPQETIREQTKMCKDFAKVELRLPGLLIIDTPGHESFSNLRNRGSSLCDIAILVVDIMHGLEPQTKESIELLKQKKTPFVVALNKVDRLNEWQTSPHTDIVTTINKQKQSTKLHFEDRVKQVVVEFAELGLNVALFHQNKDVNEYISMVPTSAHSGDGMGNLIAQICELTQTVLAKRLMYSEDLQATVMEVKAIPGHGTTIDVILVNGSIKEGDTIIVAGQEGPIVTQIRALLMPQPLRELRVKSAYEHHKEVRAAQGCKIAAKDLEKALAGLPLFVAHQPDEIEIYKDELSQMLADVLGSIKVQERGVFVQASTLGSLEALLVFLTSSKIPYAGISIGPIHKRDVMKASVMLEHDPQYAVILAFDVKVERDAQELADSLEVKIFCADIIYHLFDRFTKYREDWLRKKQEEFKHLAIFPCKLRIYPENVFKTRDPIIVGVNVEAGFLKEGTMLCVPSKDFLEVGRVSSIEVNHKSVLKAAKGQDVCIKIDPIPGEAPKMYGRHFDNTDVLVSKISRESIDVIKNYFRDEMTKADWQLVLELKKTFAIL